MILRSIHQCNIILDIDALKGEKYKHKLQSSIYCSKSINKDTHNAQYRMIKQIWDWIMT